MPEPSPVLFQSKAGKSIGDMLIIQYSVGPTMAKKTLELNAINYELTKYSHLIRRSFER